MHPLDLGRLERHAHDLAAAATRLAALQASLAWGGRALRWHSPAALAFAGTLQTALGQLGAGATRLHELADSVRQHSARAATRAGELRSAAGRPGAVADAAGDIARSVHLLRPR